MNLQDFLDAVEALYRRGKHLGYRAGLFTPAAQATPILVAMLQSEPVEFFNAMHAQVLPEVDGVKNLACHTIILNYADASLIDQIIKHERLRPYLEEFPILRDEYQKVLDKRKDLFPKDLCSEQFSTQFPKPQSSILQSTARPSVQDRASVFTSPGETKEETFDSEKFLSLVRDLYLNPATESVDRTTPPAATPSPPISSPRSAQRTSMAAVSMKKRTRSPLARFLSHVKSREDVQKLCDAMHTLFFVDLTTHEKIFCYQAILSCGSESMISKLLKKIAGPLAERFQQKDGIDLRQNYLAAIDENSHIGVVDRNAASKPHHTGGKEALKKRVPMLKPETGFDQASFEKIMQEIGELELASSEKGDAALKQCHQDLLTLLSKCTSDDNKQTFCDAFDQNIQMNPEVAIPAYSILLRRCPESTIRTVFTTLRPQFQARLKKNTVLPEWYESALDDNSRFEGDSKEAIDTRKATVLALIWTEPTREKVHHPLRDHFIRHRYLYRLLIGAAVALFVALVLFMPGLNALVLSGALLSAAHWVLVGGYLHGLAGAGVALAAGVAAAFLDYIVGGVLWLVGETVKFFLSRIAYAITSIGDILWAGTDGKEESFWDSVWNLGVTVILGIPAVITTGLAVIGECIRWSAWVLYEKNTETKDTEYPFIPKRMIEEIMTNGNNLFGASNALMDDYVDHTALIPIQDTTVPTQRKDETWHITDRNRLNPIPLSEPESSSPAPKN